MSGQVIPIRREFVDGRGDKWVWDAEPHDHDDGVLPCPGAVEPLRLPPRPGRKAEMMRLGIRYFGAILTLALLLCAPTASARGSVRGYQRSNVSAGFGSGGGWQGFSPTWYPGASAWWDSDLGVTLNSSAVSAWASQIGGRSAAQATGAKQPAYTASAATYGGHGLLTFATASSQNLVDTAAITLSQPDTIYVVGRSTSSAGNYGFIDASGGAIQACYSASSSQDASIYAGTAKASSAAVSTPSIMAFGFNGAASAIYVTASDTPVATGNANTNAMGTIAIGGANRGAGFLQGEVAAVLVTSALDDPYWRRRFFVFFANRYGLAVK